METQRLRVRDRRLRERIGGLLLSRGLSRARDAIRRRSLARRACETLPGRVWVGLGAGGLRRRWRLDGNGRAAQGGDLGRGDVGAPPRPVRSSGSGAARRLHWPAARPAPPPRSLVSSAGAGVGAAGASLCTEVSGDRDFGLARRPAGLRRPASARRFSRAHPAPRRSPVARLAPRPPECSSAAFCCAGSGSTRSIASTGVRVPRTLSGRFVLPGKFRFWRHAP